MSSQGLNPSRVAREGVAHSPGPELDGAGAPAGGDRLAKQSRHVLVVEDNPYVRDMLRDALVLDGHRAEVAEDGVMGVEIALATHPEVVLIDINLPRMDGYEVARQIRRQLGREVLLIAVTACGRPDDRRRAFEAGMDAHLVKPVPLEQLAHVLAGGTV